MTHITRRFAAVGATLLITLATSCGSDESSDTTSASTADRADIVNFLLSQAGNAGVEVDSDCVLGVVARLSDADAKLLGDSARAGGGDSPALSPEGEALGAELNACEIAPATTVG